MLVLLGRTGRGTRGRRLRRADLRIGTESRVCARKHVGRFFRERDVPFCGKHAEDAEGAARAEPAFCYLFEMLDAVYDVSTGVLLGEIEKVDSAGAMGDVDCYIADLAEAVGSFVEAEELGYHLGSLCAKFSRRNVSRKRRRIRIVF